MHAIESGNKRALIGAFFAISISLFSLLVASELWMLFGVAVVFGFGYGGVSALASPMLAELFGLRSLGTILGFTVSIGGDGGSAVGAVLAGFVFDVSGNYFWAYLICAIISTMGLGLVSLIKPTSLPKSPT